MKGKDDIEFINIEFFKAYYNTVITIHRFEELVQILNIIFDKANVIFFMARRIQWYAKVVAVMVHKQNSGIDVNSLLDSVRSTIPSNAPAIYLF